MEKLQAALEKARQARNQATIETGGEMQSPPRSDDPQNPQEQPPVHDTDALWQALTPFDVPKEHLNDHRIVTREAGPNAAPFDILRTKVLLQMRQNGWKRLAITSPMPRSGKTTTACNLALGLGRQKDLRTILMDFDLRDPSVHSFFKTEPKHGVGELLTGRVKFADQAMRIGDNVACSMAKIAESDPTRLLLAEETVGLLEQIETAYDPDIIIFDLPSVLVNDDTRAFLKNVDCALIVIRSNVTKYGHFDTCEREIAEHTNVLGVVLNAYRSTVSNVNDDFI